MVQASSPESPLRSFQDGRLTVILMVEGGKKVLRIEARDHDPINRDLPLILMAVVKVTKQDRGMVSAECFPPTCDDFAKPKPTSSYSLIIRKGARHELSHLNFSIGGVPSALRFATYEQINKFIWD